MKKRWIASALVCLCGVPLLAGSSLLRFKGGTVDTAAGTVLQGSLKHSLMAETPRPAEPGLFLVQFNGPITPDMPKYLQEVGVQILEYIPDNAFAVWTTPEVLTQLAHPAIQWRGTYDPAFRISPQLTAAPKDAAKAPATKRIAISFYNVIGDDDLSRALGSVGAAVIKGSRSDWQAKFILEVPSGIVDTLAKLPGVKWVEEYVAPELHYVQIGSNGASGPVLFNQAGAGIMNVAPVWSAGYTGVDQIVAGCDTGLDKGNTETVHADFFQDTNGDGKNDKIFKAYALGRSGNWSDPNGHGTHTSGSITGLGTKSSGNYKGIAYGSRFIIQSVLDSSGGLGGLPADLNDLFLNPYNDGARVHSNSWGASVNGAYDANAVEVDQFTWAHKDMVITISAGNSGVDSNSDGVIDADSLGSPSTAKNDICIGASESEQSGNSFTWGSGWSSSYPSDPVKSDAVANSRNGMAAFSSRGPVDDGRIKPDIVAPGTNIISVKSQQSGAGTGWGAYDTWYCYMGGTSMSNPLTAGAATVVRDYLIHGRQVATPSSALVKATLMNAARDMYPGQYGTGTKQELATKRPNSVEGWGCVDLGNSLLPASPVLFSFVDDTTGLTTGQSREWNFNITNTSAPLRLTLVWTDYPGAASSATNLVNDLDLQVTTPSGTVLYPNRGTSADRKNNAETIDIATPVAGIYKVTVSAYNVPQGPQPFAIVAHGTAGFAAAPPDTTPPVLSNVQLCLAPTTSNVTWTSDENADSKVLYGTVEPLTLNATTAGYVKNHSVDLTGLTAGTSYLFRVVSKDPSGNETQGQLLAFTTPTTGGSTVPFEDAMESGEAKWTKVAGGSYPFAITTYANSHSPTRSWFSKDEEKNASNVNKDDIIVTQAINLTGVSSAKLSFWHTYTHEDGYDGSVIEITTDNGTTWTDLGSRITIGGYNKTISSSDQSPIAGRMAWSGGTLGAMTKVEVDLSSYTGQSVKIRFRNVCDPATVATNGGWYVDDVKVEAGSCTPTTPSQPTKRGDLNGDGVVNAADLTLMLNHLTGLASAPSGADLNADGTVDAADLAILLNITVGNLS